MPRQLPCSHCSLLSRHACFHIRSCLPACLLLALTGSRVVNRKKPLLSSRFACSLPSPAIVSSSRSQIHVGRPLTVGVEAAKVLVPLSLSLPLPCRHFAKSLVSQKCRRRRAMPFQFLPCAVPAPSFMFPSSPPLLRLRRPQKVLVEDTAETCSFLFRRD